MTHQGTEARPRTGTGTGPRAHPGSFRFVLLVELVIAAVLRAIIVSRPIVDLDRVFLLDDSYYTLTIARSMAQGHGPSASAGTVTSGFQPLLGFLLVPVNWVFHGPWAPVRADLVLLAVCDVGLVAALALFVRRLGGTRAGLVAAGIWAVSPTAIRYASCGLETTLALLFDVVFLLGWLWAGDRDDATRRDWLVGILGGLVVLARIDGIALVALVFLAQAWIRPTRLLRMIVACAATLAPWWIWCTARFGTPIPQSGLHLVGRGSALTAVGAMVAIVGANALLGPLTTASPLQGRWYANRVWWPLVAFVGVMLVASVAWVRDAWRARPAKSPRWGRRIRARLAGAALCCFAVSVAAFYVWFPVPWFTYRYLAPAAIAMDVVIAVVVARVAELLRRRSPVRARAWNIGVLVVGMLVLVPQVGRITTLSTPISAGLWSSPSATVTHDSDTGWSHNARGVSARTSPDAVIAAQQSGALGWFAGSAGQQVVNLDGVVNPDVGGADDVSGICGEIRRRHVTDIADFASLGDWIARVCRPYGIVLTTSARQVPDADRTLVIRHVHLIDQAPTRGAGP